jgi:hypothetical protein
VVGKGVKVFKGADETVKAARLTEEAVKLKKVEEEALHLKKLEEEAAAARKAKGNEGGYVEGKAICKALAFKIYTLAPEVAKRFLDMMEDGLGLFKLTVNPDGTPKPSPLPKKAGTWHGHEKQLREKQKTLRDDIAAYDKNKCKQPKIIRPVRDLAYIPIPKSPGGTPNYPLMHIPD